HDALPISALNNPLLSIDPPPFSTFQLTEESEIGLPYLSTAVKLNCWVELCTTTAADGMTEIELSVAGVALKLNVSESPLVEALTTYCPTLVPRVSSVVAMPSLPVTLAVLLNTAPEVPAGDASISKYTFRPIKTFPYKSVVRILRGFDNFEAALPV